MTPIEVGIGVALVLVLTVLAGYFGWRQWQTHSLLQQIHSFPPLERDFLRGQVRRRTLCCILLALFAIVLAGWFVMEADFRELGPQFKNAAEDDEAKQSLQTSLWFYTSYMIFALVLLMIIIGLAAADLLATARYGLKHKRKLLNDHHALLALEAARLRQKHEQME